MLHYQMLSRKGSRVLQRVVHLPPVLFIIRKMTNPIHSLAPLTRMASVGDNSPSTSPPTNPMLGLEVEQHSSPGIARQNAIERRNIILCSLLACLGGIVNGYTLNVTGGLLVMNKFVIKLSHKTFIEKVMAKETNYCVYNNCWVLFFTSTINISAMVSFFMALKLGAFWGLRRTLIAGIVVLLAGIGLITWFPHISVEIVGMILFGLGTGVILQIIPMIVDEVPPEIARNTISMIFEISSCCGATLLVNFVAAYYYQWSWRLSFGAAGIPAAFLCWTAYALVEASPRVESGWRSDLVELLSSHSHPILMINTMAVVCRQLAGLSVFIFFGPFLLQSSGYTENEAFLAPLVASAIGTASTGCLAYFLRAVGRRMMLFIGCIATFTAQEWTFVALAVVSIVSASFVFFFLVPETEDREKEEVVEQVWRRHWFWQRYMLDVPIDDP